MQDPARHSTVFTKEKKKRSADEERKEKERRKEKYMHSKMPKRPDVTQEVAPGLPLPASKVQAAFSVSWNIPSIPKLRFPLSLTFPNLAFPTLPFLTLHSLPYLS